MHVDTRALVFQNVLRECLSNDEPAQRRRFTWRVGVFAVLLASWSAVAFADPALNCSLPPPTDALPTTPRPSRATGSALTALNGMVPVGSSGAASGTNRTITVALIGNSNSMVYAAGTVDALRSIGGLRPDLRLLEAGYPGAGITQYASLAPTAPLPRAAQRAIDAKVGMPQVVVWWTTKIRPDVNGPATRADVVAVLRAIKTVWPTVRVVYVAEMHGAAYLDPSVSQPLVRHSAIAKEANLFHAMESDQVGVPAGMVMLHLPMVTNGATPNALVGPLSWSCHMHKADAVHPASAEIFGLQAGEIDSQALVGGNVGHRLATDPILHPVLFGGTSSGPTTRIPLPDATIEIPTCVVRATIAGTVRTIQAPTAWCDAF